MKTCIFTPDDVRRYIAAAAAAAAATTPRDVRAAARDLAPIKKSITLRPGCVPISFADVGAFVRAVNALHAELEGVRLFVNVPDLVGDPRDFADVLPAGASPDWPVEFIFITFSPRFFASMSTWSGEEYRLVVQDSGGSIDNEDALLALASVATVAVFEGCFTHAGLYTRCVEASTGLCEIEVTLGGCFTEDGFSIPDDDDDYAARVNALAQSDDWCAFVHAVMTSPGTRKIPLEATFARAIQSKQHDLEGVTASEEYGAVKKAAAMLRRSAAGRGAAGRGGP